MLMARNQEELGSNETQCMKEEKIKAIGEESSREREGNKKTKMPLHW